MNVVGQLEFEYRVKNSHFAFVHRTESRPVKVKALRIVDVCVELKSDALMALTAKVEASVVYIKVLTCSTVWVAIFNGVVTCPNASSNFQECVFTPIKAVATASTFATSII